MADKKDPAVANPYALYPDLAAHLALDRKVCIWDIDNCLADDSARVPLIEWGLKGDARYDEYNRCMVDDPVANKWAWDLFCALHARPIFFTGRPYKFEAMTRRWLLDDLNLSTGEYELFMRKGLDRPADVKKAMLHTLLTTTPVRLHHIIAAFDDVPAIVEVYRAHGIPAAVLYANKEHAAYSEDDLKPAGQPA